MEKQLERKCPFCEEKFFWDADEIKIEKMEYKLSKVILFYQIRLFTCKKCKKKIF